MWICGTCEILRRGPCRRCLPCLGPADSLLFPQVLWFCLGCCDQGLVGECFLGTFLPQQKRCWLCKESWCCIREVPRSSVTTDLWNNRPSVTVWVAFTQHVRPTVYFCTHTLIVEGSRNLHTLQLHTAAGLKGRKLRLINFSQGLKVQMQKRKKSDKILLHTNLLVLTH